MQKLKVYLTKQSLQNKTTIDKIKLNVLKTKPHALQHQLQRQKSNNHSTHNLSRSNNSNYAPNHHISTTNNNNSKKRTMSNVHNRSLQQMQQVYDFRNQVRNLIKDSSRYEKFKQYSRKQAVENKNNDKQRRIIHENKKNSKQIASDSNLNYRSQPHRELDRIFNKNSQKKLDDIGDKKITKSNQSNPSIQIKQIVGFNSKSKQRIVGVSKNVMVSKIPIKKRSKSANPQNKKPIPHSNTQNPKQKRSKSQIKVHKNIQNTQFQSSLKNTNEMLATHIQLRSMFRTRKGVQIMNPNKVNQDRIYVKENVLIDDQRNLCVYAVADGHGPNGHFVSHLIVENLHKRLDHHLKQPLDIEQSLQKSYNDIQSMLSRSSQFSAQFSGSTLVTLVIQNYKNLICANVGDSRAIVAKQLSKTSWEVIRLSNDHKPSVEDQRKRILSQGGRIETVYDQQGKHVGPLRVWLPKKQIQGLAMSRSLGDNISKPYGVTHIPEILVHQLTHNDKFILLASDGVWQFLTNYQILSLIIPYYRQRRLEDACQALMKQAHRSWTQQDNSVIDDISFILIFLDNDKNSVLPASKQEQLPLKSQMKKVSENQQSSNQQKIKQFKTQLISNEKDISLQDSLENSRARQNQKNTKQ